MKAIRATKLSCAPCGVGSMVSVQMPSCVVLWKLKWHNPYDNKHLNKRYNNNSSNVAEISIRKYHIHNTTIPQCTHIKHTAVIDSLLGKKIYAYP